jgi:hypothetical protein
MLPDEELAELLAETVRCTLEPAHTAPADALQAASHAFTQYLNRTTAIVEGQFRQEVEF